VTTIQRRAHLRVCHSLLQTMDASGQGIQPSPAELALLQGFEKVAKAAAARPDGESWFAGVQHRAGLPASSGGLLSGGLHSWYAVHLP
jgi:hypothetical protein